MCFFLMLIPIEVVTYWQYSGYYINPEHSSVFPCQFLYLAKVLLGMVFFFFSWISSFGGWNVSLPIAMFVLCSGYHSAIRSHFLICIDITWSHVFVMSCCIILTIDIIPDTAEWFTRDYSYAPIAVYLFSSIFIFMIVIIDVRSSNHVSLSF